MVYFPHLLSEQEIIAVLRDSSEVARIKGQSGYAMVMNQAADLIENKPLPKRLGDSSLIWFSLGIMAGIIALKLTAY